MTVVKTSDLEDPKPFNDELTETPDDTLETEDVVATEDVTLGCLGKAVNWTFVLVPVVREEAKRVVWELGEAVNLTIGVVCRLVDFVALTVVNVTLGVDDKDDNTNNSGNSVDVDDGVGGVDIDTDDDANGVPNEADIVDADNDDDDEGIDTLVGGDGEDGGEDFGKETETFDCDVEMRFRLFEVPRGVELVVANETVEFACLDDKVETG